MPERLNASAPFGGDQLGQRLQSRRPTLPGLRFEAGTVLPPGISSTGDAGGFGNVTPPVLSTPGGLLPSPSPAPSSAPPAAPIQPKSAATPAAPPVAPAAPQPPPEALPGGGGAPILQYAAFTNWYRQNFPGQGPPTFEQWQAGTFGTQGASAGSGGDAGAGAATGGDVPFNSLDRLRPGGDLHPLLAALGIPVDVDGAGNDLSFRGNVLNALGGPVFQNDPFELPGKATGLGFGLNLLLSEVLKQQDRSTEAEQLLRGNAENLGSGPAASLNRLALGDAAGLGSDREALFDQLENDLRARTATQLNSTDNRLRDLGITGLGGAGRGAAIQAGNLANSSLQRGLTDLGAVRLSQRRDDLATQLGAAQQGGSTQLALEQNPILALISTLQGPQNQAVGDLVNALLQTGNLQIGEALQNRGGSFFEEGGGQILGDLIGAAGGLAGSAISAGASNDLARTLDDLRRSL